MTNKKLSQSSDLAEYSFMPSDSNVNSGKEERVYLSPHDDHMDTTEEGRDKAEEEEVCGWLSCRPTPLQRFRHPAWVLVLLCWAGAIQVS